MRMGTWTHDRVAATIRDRGEAAWQAVRRAGARRPRDAGGSEDSRGGLLRSGLCVVGSVQSVQNSYWFLRSDSNWFDVSEWILYHGRSFLEIQVRRALA